MINSIKRLIPTSVKIALKLIYYLLLDAADFVSGRAKGKMLPPRRMIFVGDGDFQWIGEEFLGYFKNLCDLKPSERIIDVGCGIGRMAIPLTRYLNENGIYEGFDIVKQGIDWCKKRIFPKYPNFHFQLVDIFNKEYNPKGRIPAKEYHFPFDDETFDFVFLTSIFTHMLPQDLEHYLAEISRILRSSKRCLITFFLLNSKSLNLARQGRNTIDFKYDMGVCRTRDNRVPESAVAYYENYIRALFEKVGLTIKKPIHYGSWSGRTRFLSYQDIVVAWKP